MYIKNAFFTTSSYEKTSDHLVWHHELSKPNVPSSCSNIELNSHIECDKAHKQEKPAVLTCKGQEIEKNISFCSCFSSYSSLLLKICPWFLTKFTQLYYLSAGGEGCCFYTIVHHYSGLQNSHSIPESKNKIIHFTYFQHYLSTVCLNCPWGLPQWYLEKNKSLSRAT